MALPLGTQDCDVTAIDKPFLQGMLAFTKWILDKRKALAEPVNPYPAHGFEYSAWETGFGDGLVIWLSWQ
jgi:hypothetical protein